MDELEINTIIVENLSGIKSWLNSMKMKPEKEQYMAQMIKQIENIPKELEQIKQLINIGRTNEAQQTYNSFEQTIDNMVGKINSVVN